MGAGASVDDCNEEVYKFSNSNIRPRTIYAVDLDARIITCKRETPSEANHALSHRWEGDARDGSMYLQWNVNVEGEDPYTCRLTIDEATNLHMYLSKYGQGLWLDYVCINQGSMEDKNAQVSIMGQIYLGCCTLVVGPSLSPHMPPKDYTSRAWCVQERMFGAIKFPFLENPSQCDPEQLQHFAQSMIWRIPAFGDALKIMHDYDYTEGWRVDSLRIAAEHHAHVSDKIHTLIEMMTNNQDKMGRAVLALQVREAIPCLHDVEDPGWPGKWDTLMFTCDCQYPKDRLYGIWGVSMYQKGIRLPYDNVKHAFTLIRRYYPQVEFACYTTVPDEFVLGSPWSSKLLVPQQQMQETDVVLFNALTGENVMAQAAPLPATYVIIEVLDDSTFVVAITENDVGLGYVKNAENGAVDATQVPMQLVMPRKLIREYHGGRPHYVLMSFCQMVEREGGLSSRWNRPYAIWSQLISTLREKVHQNQSNQTPQEMTFSSIGDTLSNDASLTVDQCLVSQDGRWKLVYQQDGHLCAYDIDNQCFWATGKYGVPPGRTVMQSDGNLVCYDSSNHPYWASDTWNQGQAPFRLVMQNDRNVVLYDSTDRPTWASNTNI